MRESLGSLSGLLSRACYREIGLGHISNTLLSVEPVLHADEEYVGKNMNHSLSLLNPVRVCERERARRWSFNLTSSA